MPKDISFKFEGPALAKVDGRLTQLDSVVKGVAGELGFVVVDKTDPNKPKSYDILLEKDGMRYRFLRCYHDEGIGKNKCPETEDYIFYLNKDQFTNVRIKVGIIYYSNSDSGISGISSARVGCALFSEDELSKRVVEGVGNYYASLKDPG